MATERFLEQTQMTALQRRQQRIDRAQQSQAPPVQQFDTSTPEGQIEQQRYLLNLARENLAKSKSQLYPVKRAGFTSRSFRQLLFQKRSEVSSQEGELAKTSQEFEKSVSEYQAEKRAAEQYKGGYEQAQKEFSSSQMFRGLVGEGYTPEYRQGYQKAMHDIENSSFATLGSSGQVVFYNPLKQGYELGKLPQLNLPKGEIPVFDNMGNLKGIQSEYLQKTIPVNNYSKAIEQQTLKYQQDYEQYRKDMMTAGYDPDTGRLINVIRPATTTEKIAISKPYRAFMKYSEPIRLVAGGFAGLAASGPGYLLDPYFNAGRNEQDTSTLAKIGRGGLMAGKTGLLYTNPYTGTLASAYFGGKAIQSAAESPLGFVTNLYSYAKSEPYELIGGLVGGIGATKVKDYVRTMGRKNIPVESLVTKEILTGKKQFPTAPTSTHLNEFLVNARKLPGQIKPAGFHAAPQLLGNIVERFKGELVIKGSKSELPGLYIAPSISTHFLKIGNKGFSIPKPKMENFPNLISGYLYSTFQGLKTKPMIAHITPTEFILGKKGKPGQAYIPKIKTEIEAIIAPESVLSLTGKRYYIKYQGRRIPIDEFIALGKQGKLSMKDKVLAKDIEKKYSSYSKTPSKPSYLYTQSYKKQSRSSIAPAYNPSRLLMPTPSKTSYNKQRITTPSKISQPRMTYNLIPYRFTTQKTTSRTPPRLPPRQPPYLIPKISRDINSLIFRRDKDKENKKRKKKSSRKGKTKYQTLPTAFEMLVAPPRKGSRPLTTIRGFEVMRFQKPRNRVRLF